MENKVALVTGAGKGIGRGVAIKLAQAGYDIGVHYGNSRDGAIEVSEKVKSMGRKAIILQANIQEVNEIDNMYYKLFKEFDHIDVLVNNAGVTRMAPFLDVGEEMWSEVINTDLKGSFFCAQRAARKMVDDETKGVIINITSNHSIGCWPNSTVYAPAKSALDKLTKNMALDLAKYGIRVVAIAPGYTELEWFSEESKKYIAKTAKKYPCSGSQIPKR